MNSLVHKNSLTSKPFIPVGKIKPRVQTKLTINKPGDQYEQEADAMADWVMRMPAKENNSKTSTGIIGASVQRKSKSGEDDEKKRPIMRKTENTNSGMQVSPSFVSSLNASKGGGSPLPNGTRSLMENAFSTDFSNVRVHTDSNASEMSKRINAKAFTYGSDIYLNNGKFAPENNEGKKLLAHELAHVAQQGNGIIRRQVLPTQKDTPSNSKNQYQSGFDVKAFMESLNESYLMDLIKFPLAQAVAKAYISERPVYTPKTSTVTTYGVTPVYDPSNAPQNSPEQNVQNVTEAIMYWTDLKKSGVKGNEGKDWKLSWRNGSTEKTVSEKQLEGAKFIAGEIIVDPIKNKLITVAAEAIGGRLFLATVGLVIPALEIVALFQLFVEGLEIIKSFREPSRREPTKFEIASEEIVNDVRDWLEHKQRMQKAKEYNPILHPKSTFVKDGVLQK